ncbi:MAG: bifunctional (p)ppGpp synthetase/guanosine-3',5'-bis(diphosphate) 3'-pyrophosphohydrolase [Sphingobacteriales bacterium]|nr:MAG: bifunctional (p)ppGpp synthetase/guanosine-3',5'-bis(diphosphate) 3'-pyrophosphohydrolase [Sphingobacteriales bacterium]
MPVAPLVLNKDVYTLNAEEERMLILRKYRALLRVLKPRIKPGDKKLLRRAFEIAVEAHSEMRRKSGEPYILHPIAVAQIAVEEIGLGVTSAICALLHDVVEDTEVTLGDIEQEFGVRYARIIDGLTKISNVVDLNATTTIQAENFRKILLTLAEDPRVILIKLADRLHNMRTLDSMARDKQLKIASETTYLYSPLAHRLGLYEIKSELEDLALKYLQPEVFNEISQALKDTHRDRSRYINEFIRPLKEMLEVAGLDFKIYGRPKAINSIWNKIRTKHVTFEEVYDLFAIRIILNSSPEREKQDCWKVYSIITNVYRPSPERLRDWISVPKGNGYEALHTTVMGPGGRWVEVQIRSSRMNDIAEKGLAAHWRYKEDNAQESKLDSFLQSIRDLLLQAEHGDTLEFLQDVKLDLFTEEIYVYTPKGDMRVLPKGATALDFAFDIHSDLGTHCIGAKVNYKLVPMSHAVKSGDQVEIITSAKQQPDAEWLDFVLTGKAKSKIKSFLKEEKRRIAQDGKVIMEKKLQALGVPLSKANITEMCSFFQKTDSTDLFYGAAVGNFDLRELKNFRIEGERMLQPAKETNLDSRQLIPEDAVPHPKGSEVVIFGDTQDKILYKLANCCQPIPGDDVFGFQSPGEGVKIHRTDCRYAAQLLAHHGHRVVKTKWAKNKEISFLCGVSITGLDDVGVIQKIANVVTGDLKMNMRSLSIDSHNGVFDGTIMVFVHDREELDLLSQKLIESGGISKVERLEASDL